MEIDDPTFVPKSGYFFAILGHGSSQKVSFFLLLNHFYELAYQTICWLFRTRNPPLPLFLAVAFSQFCPNII